jgi:hypothetical protein
MSDIYDWSPDYSINTPTDLGSNWGDTSNPYDFDSGYLGSNLPSINDSSQDWLNYFDNTPGVNWGDNSGGINWGGIGGALGNLGSAVSGGINSAANLFGQGAVGSQLMGLLGGGYGIANQIDWQELLGQGRDLAGKTGSLISGYTPYTGEEAAGLTDAQKQGIGYAPGLMQQGNQWLSSAGNYDPSQIQNYLNPYTEGALSAANRLTSQNLTENILPGVNSTFTGAGQFGSTRNAEFGNRAIRDTQQAIADANAKGMVNAYGQASTDYRGMLGQQGTLGQQAITQGMGLAGTEQQNNQQQVEGALAAWQRNRTMPLDMFKSWSGGVGQFNPAGAGTTANVFDPTKLGL